MSHFDLEMPVGLLAGMKCDLRPDNNLTLAVPVEVLGYNPEQERQVHMAVQQNRAGSDYV